MYHIYTYLTSCCSFIIDEKNKVMFCSTPKAACSTWKGILANISSQGLIGSLAQKKQFQKLHSSSYLGKYGLRRSSKIPKNIKDYTTFLVTRNPMDRLISAYYDKMHGQEAYFKHIADKIVKRYRPTSTNKCQPLCKHPTFEEFVQMLLDKKSEFAFEPHWQSAIVMCNPCLIKYDYILKVETLNQDIDLFLKNAYKKDVFQYIGEKKVNRNRESDLTETTDNLHKILLEFNLLSDLQIKKLIKKYRYDFEFYGYGFDHLKFTHYCHYTENQTTYLNSCC